MNLKGKFRIAVLGEDDEVLETREFPNTIMNAGKAQCAGLVLTDLGTGSVGAAFDYLAIGTGTTAPNATQTALIGEKYRMAATGSRITTSVANDTARLTGNFAITSSITASEIGVLNSSSAGVILARTTFSGVSVTSGNTIQAGYDIIFS